MLCKRCPHLVRHGQVDHATQQIEFKSMCGLIMKKHSALENPIEEVKGKPVRKAAKKATKKDEEEPNMTCANYPFPSVFDYIECGTYQETFKSSTRKNDVVPTRDFQYSDVLSGSSITDMELL